MLQRVQSLYLLCSVIFLAIFAFMPYFNIVTPDAEYVIDCFGIEASKITNPLAQVAPASSNYIAAILTALIAIMSVIAIFMYSNRSKQILVCKINCLFYVALYAVMGIYAFTNYDALGGTTFTTTSFVVFPICALITNWLAWEAIKKDEKIVRDSERMWTRK